LCTNAADIYVALKSQPLEPEKLGNLIKNLDICRFIATIKNEFFWVAI